MWELDCEESWAPKNWCFWTVVLEKTLESPLDARRSNQSILKEISPGISLEGMMLKLKLQYFAHLMRRVDSLEKTLMLGGIWGQEEKGTTKDEMAGWHHWLDGREFEWTPGVGDGQGGLACCDSRSHKELDTTQRLNWNWTSFSKPKTKPWRMRSFTNWGMRLAFHSFSSIVCLSTYEPWRVWTRRGLGMNGLVQIKAARMCSSFFFFFPLAIVALKLQSSGLPTSLPEYIQGCQLPGCTFREWGTNPLPSRVHGGGFELSERMGVFRHYQALPYVIGNY